MENIQNPSSNNNPWIYQRSRDNFNFTNEYFIRDFKNLQNNKNITGNFYQYHVRKNHEVFVERSVACFSTVNNRPSNNVYQTESLPDPLCRISDLETLLTKTS